MWKRVLIDEYKQILYKQFLDCYLGTKFVIGYANKFQRLSTRYNLNEEGLLEVLRFVSGLCDPIRDKLNTIAFLTWPKAISLTTKFKYQLARHAKVSSFKKPIYEQYTNKPKFISLPSPSQNPVRFQTKTPNDIAMSLRNLGKQPMVKSSIKLTPMPIPSTKMF